jgi:hypothetical protein
MAFMQSTSGEGNFKVYATYNAKAGRWYTKEDKPDADLFEVTNLTAIFDMDNLRTGWFLFTPGVAPIKHFDPSLTEPAPKPGDGFKKGFELDIFSEMNLGGVREFASTAGIVIDAMNDLHTDWESQRAANPGKLPVVKCIAVHPVTNKHGTNYKPEFKIVSWADRPAELAAPAAAAPAAPPPAAAKPAAHTPPPAAKAPEPAATDDEVVF